MVFGLLHDLFLMAPRADPRVYSLTMNARSIAGQRDVTLLRRLINVAGGFNKNSLGSAIFHRHLPPSFIYPRPAVGASWNPIDTVEFLRSPPSNIYWQPIAVVFLRNPPLFAETRGNESVAAALLLFRRSTVTADRCYTFLRMYFLGKRFVSHCETARARSLTLINSFSRAESTRTHVYKHSAYSRNEPSRLKVGNESRN